MKYQLHGVEHTSKITSNWEVILNMDFGHVNIEEFRQRVLFHPQIDALVSINKIGLVKVVGLSPSLIALELVMASWECYYIPTIR
jgi:hypothetical protein